MQGRAAHVAQRFVNELERGVLAELSRDSLLKRLRAELENMICRDKARRNLHRLLRAEMRCQRLLELEFHRHVRFPFGPLILTNRPKLGAPPCPREGGTGAELRWCRPRRRSGNRPDTGSRAH